MAKKKTTGKKDRTLEALKALQKDVAELLRVQKLIAAKLEVSTARPKHAKVSGSLVVG
jgi:hypothetical protein